MKKARDSKGGAAIGVIGSNRTTNEENYLLQKFARTVLGTHNVDHHRTADFPGFAAALQGKTNSTTSMSDVYHAPAILLIGNDPTNQHPLLAWQIRNNVRLHKARLYVVNAEPIKLRRQATRFVQIPAGSYHEFASFLADSGQDGRGRPSPHEPSSEHWNELRETLRAEPNLVIIFGSEIFGTGITALAKFASGIPGAKLVCLGDYANSRGAADMGLYPDLLPGYFPVSGANEFREAWGSLPETAGLNIPQMFDAAKSGKLKALYVIGANPVGGLDVGPATLQNTFVVVQDMFLTETATLAEVVLPAANAYEKAGTFTNTCGDIQILKTPSASSTMPACALPPAT